MDPLGIIRNAYPEVYERTSYNTVEIGGRLAKLKEELLVPRPTASLRQYRSQEYLSLRLERLSSVFPFSHGGRGASSIPFALV